MGKLPFAQCEAPSEPTELMEEDDIQHFFHDSMLECVIKHYAQLSAQNLNGRWRTLFWKLDFESHTLAITLAHSIGLIQEMVSISLIASLIELFSYE